MADKPPKREKYVAPRFAETNKDITTDPTLKSLEARIAYLEAHLALVERLFRAHCKAEKDAAENNG